MGGPGNESDWRNTYHRFDVRMWHGIEFVIFELEFGPNVDIGALVFGRVTVLRCREDCNGQGQSRDKASKFKIPP